MKLSQEMFVGIQSLERGGQSHSSTDSKNSLKGGKSEGR